MRRPHIISITCHDLGRRLGCYGVRLTPSPNLDRLAEEGVRFDRAFATAPQCSPSRASLATGRYPHETGVLGLAHGGYGWELNEDERHVAGLLAGHGYETHLFGVQHVTTEHVERLGFDHIHERTLAAPVADAVVELLCAGPPPAPLYVEANLEQAHRPYDQGGARPDEIAGLRPPAWLPQTEAAEEEVAALRGAIEAADAAIGRILAALDDAGLRGDALVVFSADHGLAMPRAKCTLYDPGLAIALLMRWPHGLRGSRAIDALVSNVDVLPTMLEAVGLPVPDRVTGRSFWPLLAGRGQRGRDTIHAEKTFHSYYDPMRAIRTDRFKLIRNFETALPVQVPADVQAGAIFRTSAERYTEGQRPDLELYDLAADPLEHDDVADHVDYADVRRELDARLWRWMTATDDPLLHGPVASPAYRRTMAQRPPWIGAAGRD